MSRLKSGQKPLVTRAIRLDENMVKWFDKKGLNMSLVCRDLLSQFMNFQRIPDKYYFERAHNYNQKHKQRNYEN